MIATIGQRFPAPDFEQTNHQVPVAEHPLPSVISAYADVFLLALALAVTVWLVHRRRNRSWIFGWMVICLAYFGFYKQGCVCPIGAIQNVSLGIFSGGYAVPLTVIAVFLLPLLTALFYGRVFCAAVCPLGAVQDAVVIRNPVRLPVWLREGLGLIPYAYLAVAVLLAASGGAFIICQYDPFVAFFRLSGSGTMLLVGGLFLAVGVFIARPYCRFVCPYGVLLGWLARFSAQQITITPAACIQCRLCENACPFDAITVPEPPLPEPPRPARRRLIRLLAVLPILILIGGWLGHLGGERLSTVHARVRLAQEVRRYEQDPDHPRTDATDAFLGSGENAADLFEDAQRIRHLLLRGGVVAGGFLALILGMRLIRLSTYRTQTDYTPDPAQCLACGRCYAYCPVPPASDQPQEDSSS